MAETLAEQFGPDTIRKYERAAPQRLKEADMLASAGFRLTSVYLYGYVVEMLIKAAYFRMLRYGATTEIDRDTRIRAMTRARQNHWMSHEPHDLVGWARLLVSEKDTLYPPPYDKKLAQQIVDKAAVVYEKWRPEMRYRVTEVSKEEVRGVSLAARWFIEHSSKM